MTYNFINPDHYKRGGKEVIEMMVDIWGAEAVATHCEITAFKYRMRLGLKPGQPIEQDYEKAFWYESKAKELRGVSNGRDYTLAKCDKCGVTSDEETIYFTPKAPLCAKCKA